MEDKIIIDTNIWVASVNIYERDNKYALEVIGKTKNKVMPDFILQETINVLKIKNSHKESAEFYKNILNNKDVTIIKIETHTDDFYDEFFSDENYKLSFVDSALLRLHKSKYFKVITLDKNLKERLDKVKVKKRN